MAYFEYVRYIIAAEPGAVASVYYTTNVSAQINTHGMAWDAEHDDGQHFICKRIDRQLTHERLVGARGFGSHC